MEIERIDVCAPVFRRVRGGIFREQFGAAVPGVRLWAEKEADKGFLLTIASMIGCRIMTDDEEDGCVKRFYIELLSQTDKRLSPNEQLGVLTDA